MTKPFQSYIRELLLCVVVLALTFQLTRNCPSSSPWSSTRVREQQRIAAAANNARTPPPPPLRLKTLIYITTHLSETHLAFLRQCWPAMLRNGRLFPQSDVTMFVTMRGGGSAGAVAALAINDTSLLRQVFHSSNNFTLHALPNPGYQQGAMLAMVEGFERGWFDGYDWVIRLNPDVLLRNETFLLEQMHDPRIYGIFADCYDRVCDHGGGNNNNSNKNINMTEALLCARKKRIHTDFMAFRPWSVDRHAFRDTNSSNAEWQATFVFESILANVAWIDAGPMRGQCRIRGTNSPAQHIHDMSQVYPACLSWPSPS
jgi:hypothetical protein